MTAASYKVLGQQAPAGTTETTLYTVTSGKQAVISTITVANITTITVHYYVNIRPAGAAVAAKHALAYGATLVPGESDVITAGLTLDQTDVISVRSDTANGAAFQAFGTEIG